MKKNTTVIFTDSGLGGISIMAEFAKQIESYNAKTSTVFFNAQYSRNFGYKKMSEKQQNEIFNKALLSMYRNYHPDIIAIACNTLSVVYRQTDFFKQKLVKTSDIIDTGISLIKNSGDATIIVIGMPTTIKSKIYEVTDKNIISIASNVNLPDAIENGDKTKITLSLQDIFQKAKMELSKKNLNSTKIKLFLGCTHFPIIKHDFIAMAASNNIIIDEVLDPNQAFYKFILKELNLCNENTKIKDSKKNYKVISRMTFKNEELNNISSIIEKSSPQCAKALLNYELNENLF